VIRPSKLLANALAGSTSSVVRSHTVVIVSEWLLKPSQTPMHTSATPRFFGPVRICSQNFGARSAIAGPQAEDVACRGRGDSDDDVDRLVADLTVSVAVSEVTALRGPAEEGAAEGRGSEAGKFLASEVSPDPCPHNQQPAQREGNDHCAASDEQGLGGRR
jgi:hypothetical protein